MADKKITDLTLRSNVNDDVNVPIDDGIQTYRTTGPQWRAYVKPSKVDTYTANQGLNSANEVVLCDATIASFTVTLPPSAGVKGTRYLIKKIDSDEAKTVTIDANSTETIDGSLTLILDRLNETVEIVSDGSNWFVVSEGSKGAGYMGSINWAQTFGAQWNRQNGSFGSMSPSGSIPTPTVTNQALDPGSNILGVKFDYMPAGTYRFVAYGNIYESGGNQNNHGSRYYDGSTATTPVWINVGAAGGASSSIEGVFNYSTPQTNKTIEIQGMSPATDTLIYDIQDGPLQIDVYFFPNV